MKRNTNKRYLEIMPAACLLRRGRWQRMARNLPVGSYVLVTNRQDPHQTRFMLKLKQLFQQKGRQAVVWSVNEGAL
jgi:hypothetical protein